MAGTLITPRSIYAGKLAEFPEIAFGDAAAFVHRGRWGDFFRSRIGAEFDGRIIFEIGCADAAFLSRISAKHPRSGFVGLDWKCKAVYDGASRVMELGLRNVALLRGRGQDVRRIFADNEIDEIWVFHPDPCDKPAELKNRLIGEAFLADAHHVLRDGGSLLALKTDHPGYYQWSLALFGLPQPEWFAVASGTTAHTGMPRTRTRDLMRRSDLPPPSRIIRSRFDVSSNSADFWNDSVALAKASHRAFAGEATQFESRFIKKRLPIYYLEMRKKRSG